MIDSEVRQEPIFAAWHRFRAIEPADFSVKAQRVCADLLELPDEKLNRLVLKQFQQTPQSMQQVAEIYGQLLSRLELVVCESESERRALQELKQLMQGEYSPFRMPDEDIVSTEHFFETRVCEALWKLQGEVERWIIQQPAAPDFATILVDRGVIREPHILRRGNPRMIAQRVPRQFLSALSVEPTVPTHNSTTSNHTVGSSPHLVSIAGVGSERIERRPFQQGSGRKELAEAIADRRNPVTARVWVNRLWQHLLGQGLVTTPSDFGLRATPPSHPELLDYLALDLIANDYSTKQVIRKIVCSATYQRSSKIEDDAGRQLFAKAEDLDPDNRWLWRGNTKRLTFEQQRDSWLVASGQLDNSFGGRAKQLFGEGLNTRRTLYGLIDRQFLSGVLRSFDFANPDLHIPQRSETTVPQQALFELNHDFAASMARALAGELTSQLHRRQWKPKSRRCFNMRSGVVPRPLNSPKRWRS